MTSSVQVAQPPGGAQPERAFRLKGPEAVLLGVAGLVVLVLAYVLLWSELPNEGKGGVAALLMVVLLMLRVPVGAAMAVAGGLGIYALVGRSGLANSFGDLPYNSTASFTLTVLPMYILMGVMLWRSGITTELYATARHWVGWMPGGLAVTTNVAGAGLASVSGSTIGITYALGRIGIPEMLKAGYHPRLAIGSVMVAGTIGQLIPPSIYAVVYAGFAELPVGPQLLAGLLPGLLLAVAYAVLIISYAMINPSLVGGSRTRSGVRSTWADRWRGLAAIWPLPALVLFIIGGLYLGLFTATESGAFGAVWAVFVAAVRLPWRQFLPALIAGLRDTLVSVGSILFLLMGAAVLNRFLALSGGAQWLGTQIQDAGIGRIQFILLMIVIYLILGCFMEPISMMLLTLPILLPAAVLVGIEPIWFGVFFILMAEIGLLTPPLGILVFVTHRLAQDRDVRGDLEISLGTVFSAAMWFLPGALFVVAAITVFPDIVTFIPDLGSAK